jgi:hypothetical protein
VNASEFHDALKAAGRSYSALSWNGFNVFGDETSIAEVRRLLHQDDVVGCLRDELIETRRRAASSSG